jgi:hypothetical protein
MSSSTLLESTLISRNPDPIVADVDGEIVMMSIDSGKYHGLDEVGSRIWRLLEEPMLLSQLIALLQKEYDADYERCLLDTIPFLQAMTEHSLLKLE